MHNRDEHREITQDIVTLSICRIMGAKGCRSSPWAPNATYLSPVTNGGRGNRTHPLSMYKEKSNPNKGNLHFLNTTLCENLTHIIKHSLTLEGTAFLFFLLHSHLLPT